MIDQIGNVNQWKAIDSFVLCQNGFVPAPENITEAFVKKNNPYMGYFSERKEELEGFKKYDPVLLPSNIRKEKRRKFFKQIKRIRKKIRRFIKRVILMRAA